MGERPSQGLRRSSAKNHESGGTKVRLADFIDVRIATHKHSQTATAIDGRGDARVRQAPR